MKRVITVALGAVALALFVFAYVRVQQTTTCLGLAHEHCLFESSAHPPRDLEAWREQNREV